MLSAHCWSEADLLARASDQLIGTPYDAEALQRLRDLYQRYQAWYDRSREVLPDDLHKPFTSIYSSGGSIISSIKRCFTQAASSGDVVPADNCWEILQIWFQEPLAQQRAVLFLARRRIWAGVSALPHSVARTLATLCKQRYTLVTIKDLFIASGCEPAWRIPPFKPHDSQRMNEVQGWLDGILVYAPNQEVTIVQAVCAAMLEKPRLSAQNRQTLFEIVAQLAAPAPANPLDMYHLHPTVRALAGPLFASQHLDEAVLKVYIALNEEVKRIAGQPSLDGVDLMRKVFSPTAGLFQIASDRGEQTGWMDLFAGAIAAIRNPRAHRLNPAPDLDETIAWLVFASALFRTLDRLPPTTS